MRKSIRPSRPGYRRFRRWIMKMTIPERPGTSGPARASPNTCRRAWPGAPFRPHCRVRQSFPRTSATTAPSAMPTRPSRRDEISGARPLRPLRLWLSRYPRGQDRLPRYTGGGICRRWCVRHIHERDDGLWARRVACDHHGYLPQLSVGRGKAQHHALVQR